MNRRTFLAAAIAIASAEASPGQAQTPTVQFADEHPLRASWEAWKALCLADDGRVLDGAQNDDSHSEGQSYGLTFATLFDDDEAADLIDAWTQANLLVRGDALMAWRWRHEEQNKVPDTNNASDGDLLYAWALLIRSRKTGRLELEERARTIVADLVRICVVEHPDGGGGVLFLPGERGFTLENEFVINPSYYIPHALRDLGESFDEPVLLQLADEGERLIDGLASAGPMPDWVSVTASGTSPPPDRFSQFSGYEAIRVPLYALWSRRAESAAVKNYAAAVAADNVPGLVPIVFDPSTGVVLERSNHAGYRAVAALSACASQGAIGSTMPRFTTDQPYYPASLHLMALLAQINVYPRCVPI